MTTENDIPRSRFNTSAWNRARYSLWAPVYNLVTGGFGRQRRRALELLSLKPKERVLIVGAGTGLDLDFFPPDIGLTAIDVTPAMVKRLQRRAARLGLTVDAHVMDGHVLEFPDATFDAVVLHLIVAVIPDPVRCMREANRVLKPAGRAVVFDKFLPDQGRANWGLRLINPLIGFLASEVTRKLEPIIAGSGLKIVHSEPALLRGLFKIVLLQKDRTPSLGLASADPQSPDPRRAAYPPDASSPAR